MKQRVIAKSNAARRSGRVRNRILLLFACLVVCVTSYVLMVPASTMETEYLCGLDAHSHGVSCYGQDANGETVLICEKEEHQHDERCLVAEAEPERYICGYSYEHEHEDGCYRDGFLVCTLVEHSHTIECLDPEYRVVSSVSSSAVDEDGLLLTGAAPADAVPSENERELVSATPSDADAALSQEELAPDKAQIEEADSDNDELIEANEDGIINLVEQEDVSLVFSISKNDGTLLRSVEKQNDIDTSLLSGRGYAFSLDINSSRGLASRRTYYYDINCHGCSLFMTDGGKNRIAIEEYAKDWVDIGSISMKVERTGDVYRFYFLRQLSGRVTFVQVQGVLDAAKLDTPMAVSKTSVWDVANLAYRFTITATIPHAVDDYSQYYFLQDNTVVTELQASKSTARVEYLGFLQNAGNGSFSVQLNGTEIAAIENVGSDDSFAYYLDQENGNLYILNKTKHSGEHYVSELAGLKDGWCLCWQQTEDMTLTVSYDDIYGRRYVLNNEYLNAVNLCNQNILPDGRHEFVSATAQGENRSELLLKEYSSDDSHTFTITFNSEVADNTYPDDLQVHTQIILSDWMENARVKTGESLLVSRRANSASSEETLTEGSDYTVSMVEDRTSFQVTLLRPGQYTYFVRYPIERLDSAVETIGNTVKIGFSADQFTSIERTIGPKYDSNNSSYDSGAFYFEVSLKKQYEGNNPPVGASFAVYDASDDTLVARSYTENGQTLVRVLNDPYDDYATEYPYVEGGNVDLVTFNSDYLDLDTVYYIVETEAPEHFEASTQRYYFYVTKSATPSVPAGNYDPSAVTVLNTWERNQYGDSVFEYTFPDSRILMNYKFHYELPETGSSLALTIRVLGFMLLLSPALLLVRNKRKQ